MAQISKTATGIRHRRRPQVPTSNPTTDKNILFGRKLKIFEVQSGIDMSMMCTHPRTPMRDSALNRSISEEPVLSRPLQSIEPVESRLAASSSREDSGEITEGPSTKYEERRYFIQNPVLRSLVKIASCGLIVTVSYNRCHLTHYWVSGLEDQGAFQKEAIQGHATRLAAE